MEFRRPKDEWLLALLVLLPAQLPAQATDASELKDLADEIAGAANEEFDCELVVLSARQDQAGDSAVVQVLSRGQACAAALEYANDRGRAQRVSFIEVLRLSPTPRPRRPPENFDLIHEIIE